MTKYDLKKVILIVVILLCSAIFLLFDKFPSQASIENESNRYYIYQASNDNLTIISPRNFTYGKVKIPIVVENTSFVNACWYRYDNGSGWSNNFTLISNGMVFQDLYTIWSEGNYHLQVFSNESGKEICSDQWFEISLGQLGTYWSDFKDGMEQYAYTVFESVNGSIYLGRYNAAEIYISNDNGETWNNISNGLIGANSIYRIGQTSNGTLFAGTSPYGDIFKSTDGGKSWYNSSNGLIGATKIYSILELENGSILSATYPNGDIFISHDHGSTWKNTSTGLGVFSKPWNLIQSKNGSIYIITNNGLFISNDGGATLDDITEGLNGLGNYRCLTQLLNGSLYIPVSNSTHSFIGISNNGGSNWKYINSPAIPGSYGNRLIETNNNTIYLSTSEPSNIFRSNDGGITWVDITYNLENSNNILELSDGSIMASIRVNHAGLYRLPIINSTRGDGIDLAIFLGFANITGYWISNETQNGIQQYLKNNLEEFQSITSYRYYEQDLLSNWVNDHLNDSVPDVILFLDRVPANLFAGEDDGSKLEEFFEDGNTIMFTGKSPCANSVDELGNSSYFGPAGLKAISDYELQVTYQNYTFYKNDIYGNPIPSLESNYISQRPLNAYSSRTSVTAFSSCSEGYHDCVFANVIGSGQYFSIYMIDNDTLNRNSTIEEFLENYYLPYYNLTYDGNVTQFTFDPKNEYGLSDPVVFGSENKVFYIWHSSRGDSVDLWYKTSLNGGKSWSAPVRLDIAAIGNRDRSPSICLDDQDNIYVAWESNYGGDYNVWFTNTSDWGKNWEPAKKLTNNINNDENVRLKIDSLGNLYLIFLSQRSPQGLYIVNSTDKGATWSEAKLIYGYDYSDDKIHDFIIDNSDIFYIIYPNASKDTTYNSEIFLINSSNHGNTWSIPERITDNLMHDVHPSISIDKNNNKLVFWTSYRNNQSWEIFFKFKNGTNPWSIPIQFTNDPRFSHNGYSLGTKFNEDNELFIFFTSNRGGNFDIFFITIKNATEDLDNDGLIGLEEYCSGTDPLVNDTDGDGSLDGYEVHNGYNPLIPNSIYLEEWNATWGGTNYDQGRSISIDDDNNIYACGKTESFGNGNGDAFLIKYNAIGHQIWNLTWGGLDNDRALGVINDKNGNIIINGDTNSYSENEEADIFVAKFDSDGNLLWNTTWGGYGGESCYRTSPALDNNENIYVTGATDSFGSGSNDVFLIKFNSTGYRLWNYTWGGSNNDASWGGVAISGEYIYIVGRTMSYGLGDYDVFTIKFDLNGNLIWNTTWGGISGEMGEDVFVDNNDNIYVIGSTSSYGAGESDAFILKYDENGTKIWNYTWGGLDIDMYKDIIIDNSSLIYLIGSKKSFGDGSKDVIIHILNQDGVYIMEKIWCGLEYESGWGISLDNKSNIYISGETNSSGDGDMEVFLVKYGLDTDRDGTTNDLDIDDDNDGISDQEEINIYNTDPLTYDSFLNITKINSTNCVQGENSTIYLEINNSLDSLINVNISIFEPTNHFYPIYYSNITLYSGNNKLYFNITSREILEALGSHLIIININRLATTIISKIINTTIFKTYMLENITTNKFTIQGENCTISLEIYNNRTTNVPINISLEAVDFYSIVYRDITLNIGLNLITINITANEFASFGLHLIYVNITRFGNSIMSITTNTTILPAYILENMTISEFTIQGEDCSISLEIYNNRSISVPINISLEASGFSSILYRNINLEMGSNHILVNITADEFELVGDHSIYFNISRLENVIFMNNLKTILLPAYILQDISADSFTIQGENCSISLEIYNNRSIAVPINISLDAANFSSIIYQNINLKEGSNQILVNITTNEFIDLGIHGISVNIRRYNNTIISQIAQTTTIQAYSIINISTDLFTIRGEICSLSLGIYNNRSQNVPINLSLSAIDFSSIQYRDINLEMGLNKILVNITANEFASLGLHWIHIDIIRLGNIVLSSDMNTTIITAYILENFSSKKFTVQGENCSISLEIYNNRSIKIPINISLKADGFNSIKYQNINLEMGINNIFVNITAHEFESIGNHSIYFNISRLNNILFMNSINTNIVPAYIIENISVDSTTIWGENCTISLEIYNNRTIAIPVNISLDANCFSPIYYHNMILDVGFNQFYVAIKSKESANLDNYSISLNITRLGYLIHSSFYNTYIIKSFYFQNLSCPQLIRHNTQTNLKLPIFNNRSIPITFTIQLNGTGYETIIFNQTISANNWEIVEIPIEYHPANLYETGNMEFNIIVSYNGEVIYSTVEIISVEMSIGNVFLGIVLPILIAITATIIAVMTTYIRRKRKLNEKLEIIKKELNLYGLNKKKPNVFLEEKINNMMESLNLIDLTRFSPEIFNISLELIDQFKKDLSNIEFYANKAKIHLDKTLMSESLKNKREILNSINRIIIKNKYNYENSSDILQKYFFKNKITNPGFFIILLNALMKNPDFDYQIVAKNYKDIENWAQNVLKYREEHNKDPDKKILWKLGIPIDDIDSILEYINIQIKTPVLDLLSTEEIEYFEDLSIEVIKYMTNNNHFKPNLQDLVIECGLGIKDAKLIMIYISEILTKRVKVNVKFR